MESFDFSTQPPPTVDDGLLLGATSPSPSWDELGPLRVAQSLLAIGVYLMFALLHELAASFGLVDLGNTRLLSAFTLFGALSFFGIVRIGLHSQLFGTGNGIVVAQCLFGVAAASWAYAIDGPIRGACLLIFLLVLVFGMFALRPPQARVVAASGLAMLAVAAYVAWRAAEPTARPVAVEVMHMSFAAVGVFTVLILSDRLSALRALVVDQKLQLEDSLDRVREMAVRDELTGLVNRRQALLRLEAEFARLERAPGDLAVALIDIDHFKQINDLHGHHAGDLVLQGFARVARSELRGTDVLARWGGEEFLLLMPATPAAVAHAALERWRVKLLQGASAGAQAGRELTFSAGIALHQHGDTVQNLIDRADQAMYAAKARGRNRTVLASPAAPGSLPAPRLMPLISADAFAHRP